MKKNSNTSSPSKRYIARNVNGILLLNKPLGFSSNQALQKVKHLFQAKKAGHTGSLDPLATGMLPICFGEATKFSHYLLDADKTYRTIAKLGAATSTGDAEGDMVETAAVPTLSESKILTILNQFLGTITQVPPMYSALKHQGQPLYKLARQGIEIERKPRSVTIHHIKLLHFSHDTLSLEVRCSKGTYIRTLVEDISKALQTLGHVQLLHRQWVMPFETQPNYELPTLMELNSLERDQLLLPIDVALQHLPVLMLSAADALKVKQGQWISISTSPDIVRLYDESQQFLGIGEIKPNGQIHPKRLVNIENSPN